MAVKEHPEARSKRELLMQGVAILRPVLEPYGFTFAIFGEGQGSGGYSAAGRFTDGDRSLELHLRHSLGLVTYRWGDDMISHADYMRWLGVQGQYPGFSDDPLDGFRHLHADLPAAAEFLEGTDRARFREACRWVREQPKKQLP